MTVTIDRYADLRRSSDAIAEELEGVSRAEALQALMIESRLLGERGALSGLVLEGDDDCLAALERVIDRTEDDLVVLRRVVEAAKAHYGSWAVTS